MEDCVDALIRGFLDDIKKSKVRLITASSNSTENQRPNTATKYIKAKIDNTQQNGKCWLSVDKDETVIHIIRECSELEPKDDKTRRD